MRSGYSPPRRVAVTGAEVSATSGSELHSGRPVQYLLNHIQFDKSRWLSVADVLVEIAFVKLKDVRSEDHKRAGNEQKDTQ